MSQKTLKVASPSNFIFDILQKKKNKPKTSSTQKEKLPSTIYAFSSWVCVGQSKPYWLLLSFSNGVIFNYLNLD